MKRWRNIAGIIIIILLLGAATVALNFDQFQGKAAYSVSNAETYLKQARHNKQKHKPNYNLKQVKPISPNSLLHAWRCRRDYRAVGQIAIPEKHVLLNIFKGVGNDELALGAGTFRADQKMGKNNYPLAGHNMDDGTSYFSPLYTAKVNGQLAKGTLIFLTDFKNVYYYQVDQAYFINAYNLRLTFNRKKFQKKPVISMFTCDWTGQGRLFIRGHLTGSQSLHSASKNIKTIFKY